jgi:hypothetical protein
MDKLQIIFTAYIVAIAVASWFYYVLSKRLKQATALRSKIIKICHEYNTRHLVDVMANPKHDAYKWCYETLPDLDKMVWSFKPIKLSTWLDEEMLDELFDIK